ncbi:DNA polymerase III subunit chi [Agaribacterium haliotis]|uniref:DNA polymerase III subunit chi n=1 Tax=Agaribacterium haliotis TaxID=2013869 RepID=UPI000BB539DB|nr:DNA polymerase III subunit chi [Agaribacterium haliotis]
MTRVSFYILSSEQEQQRLLFSCRLIEKAVNQGNRVLVHVDSAADAEQIDDLLWSFKPEAYLPHAIVGGELDDELGELPIAISCGATDCEQHHDVLLNLATQLPPWFARFKRFAQVVNQQPALLQASRKHYGFFKERGYPIETNKLNY